MRCFFQPNALLNEKIDHVYRIKEIKDMLAIPVLQLKQILQRKEG